MSGIATNPFLYLGFAIRADEPQESRHDACGPHHLIEQGARIRLNI